MSAAVRRTAREQTRVVALVAVALAVVGAVGLLWRPLAPPVPALESELAAFSPAVLETVAAYRGPRYLIFAVATVLELLLPLLVVFTVRGRRAVISLAGPVSHAPLRGGLVAFAISMVVSVATFPLAAYNRIVEDGRWGFRTQSAAGWVGDWTLVNVSTSAAVAALVVLLLVAMRRWPRSWPFRLTLVGSALGILVVMLYPLVLQPFLLPTSPMAPSPIRTQLERLLAEQGAHDLPIYVGEASLRTTRVNAMVVGLGPTERVVLYDTLLDSPVGQIESVLAHELAHHEHRDLLRGALAVPTFLLPALLVLQRVVTGGGGRRRVAARGSTDPRLAAVVVAVAVVLQLSGGSLVNLVSRRAEAAADHRAVQVVGDATARIAAARAATVRDLAPPRGPTWIRALTASHPAVEDRILAAVAQADPDALPTRQELEEQEREIAHPAVDEHPG